MEVRYSATAEYNTTADGKESLGASAVPSLPGPLLNGKSPDDGFVTG